MLHDEWLLHNPNALVLDGCRQWTAEEIYDCLCESGLALAPRSEAAGVPTRSD